MKLLRIFLSILTLLFLGCSGLEPKRHLVAIWKLDNSIESTTDIGSTSQPTDSSTGTTASTFPTETTVTTDPTATTVTTDPTETTVTTDPTATTVTTDPTETTVTTDPTATTVTTDPTATTVTTDPTDTTVTTDPTATTVTTDSTATTFTTDSTATTFTTLIPPTSTRPPIETTVTSSTTETTVITYPTAITVTTDPTATTVTTDPTETSVTTDSTATTVSTGSTRPPIETDEPGSFLASNDLSVVHYARKPRSAVSNDHRNTWSYKEDDVHGTAVCTGTLLSATSILTTASCAETVGLKVGLSLATEDSLGDPKIFELSRIVYNPFYSSVTLINNLAILQLRQTDALDSDEIESIDWTRFPATQGTDCVTSFWNTEEISEGIQLSRKKRIASCPQPYGLFTCAASDADEEAVDECSLGNEGAALICNNRVSGIFSARPSDACAEPMRYHELSVHRHWITSVVNSASSSRRSFVAAILITVIVMLTAS